MINIFKKLRYGLRHSLSPVPIAREAIVLDVGSGHNPHARANLLCEKHVNPTHDRNYEPIKLKGRPLVIADAQLLPFKNKSIDFVFSQQVIEHLKDPVAAVVELQRVGKAGYITTPHAVMEFFDPNPNHRHALWIENGKLMIYHKSTPLELPIISRVIESNKFFKELYFRSLIWDTQDYMVDYVWKDLIHYEVVNSDVNFDENEFQKIVSMKKPIRMDHSPSKLRSAIQEAIRWTAHQCMRNRKKVNVFDLLRCVDCGCESLVIDDSRHFHCKGCLRIYYTCKGSPIMLRKDDELLEQYIVDR